MMNLDDAHREEEIVLLKALARQLLATESASAMPELQIQTDIVIRLRRLIGRHPDFESLVREQYPQALKIAEANAVMVQRTLNNIRRDMKNLED